MAKKLFIGNLPWSVTGDDMRAWLVGKGYDVEKTEVILERDTGRSRGFGFLHFATDEAAAEVLRDLNDTDLAGRSIHLEEATERGSSRGGGSRGGGASRPRGAERRPEKRSDVADRSGNYWED